MNARYELLEVAAGRSLAGVPSVSTSPIPTPMIDHACGPAAHAVPATVVVHVGPSKSCQPPYAMPWKTASEQAGRCLPFSKKYDMVMARRSMGDVESAFWGLCAVICCILLVW